MGGRLYFCANIFCLFALFSTFLIILKPSVLLLQVQAAFGKEVSNCCRFLQETADWKLTRLAVHRDGEKTAEFGTKSETRTSSFTAAELGDANVNASTWQSMEEIVAKYGTAVIDAGVLYPEADTTLSHSELMAVFQKIVHRSTAAPLPVAQFVPNSRNGASPGGEIGASGASNQFYSADFKDIKDVSSAVSARGAGFSPPTGLFASDRGKSPDIGNEFGSPRPASNRHPRKLQACELLLCV